MGPVNQVYVCHFEPLVDRRRWLEAALAAIGFSAQWISRIDKRNLPLELVSRHYRYDPAVFAERASFGGAFNTPLATRWLSPAEVANGLTHISILEEIMRTGDEISLVLEDDVIFREDFRPNLEKYIAQLPPEWDILYPGSGCGLHLSREPNGPNVIRHPRSESRTADCYVIRQKAAGKILSTISPFTLPFDWELSYHQRKHGLNVYWAEPSIAFQGSELGLYGSSMDLNRVFVTEPS
jgi:GR25 family glycosyltransferase involved in LPS biosynthesis